MEFGGGKDGRTAAGLRVFGVLGEEMGCFVGDFVVGSLISIISDA